MWKRALLVIASCIAMLSPFLLWCNGVRADAPPLPQDEPPQNGVEVLTRGPIHEAFAEPLTVNPIPNPIIHQKPPPAIEEIPPDQKPEGTNIQWIPGYYAWDETGNDYIWISGLWRAPPPGRQWMPGHWMAEGDGWQWISGYWAPDGQAEIDYLPQPPASIDMGPSAPAPDANSLYAPGIWVYQNNRYLWRPGFWYPANTNWFYSPARYSYTPAGYIFSDGYWDYPLQNRGLLFSPVRFSPNLWGTPGWNYQPRYAMAVQGLLGSLFVRPSFGRYYFGDYYGAGYNQQGFVPWFNYGLGRNIPDPLYSSSRWNSRADTQWEGNLRNLYQSRLAGTAARPPVTLVQQNEFIRNVIVNKKVQIGNKIVPVTDPQSILKHMPVTTPLNKFNQQGEFKVRPVPKTTAVEHQKAAQHIAAVAVERQQREAKVISQGLRPARPMDPPARVKVVPPKGPMPPRVVHLPAPAAPVLPKHVEKPVPKYEPVKPIHVNPPKPKEKSPKEKGPKEKGKSF
jgi:hypothetical protein